MNPSAGVFVDIMLHDDIQALERQVEQQHAEIQELAANLSDAMTRIDALEKAQAKAAPEVIKPAKKAAKDTD